jgi:hypothetical protein
MDFEKRKASVPVSVSGGVGLSSAGSCRIASSIGVYCQ